MPEEVITITVLYILLAILAFGFLIFIHELGHFLAARACGVKINEFAIGMGPRLIKHQSKKRGTVYALRAFPVGGFVSMEGETEDSDNSGAYNKKPAWQKLIISLAGPVMNIILGIVLTFILVLMPRMSDGKLALPGTVITGFTENAVSDDSGLALGDRIIKVGGTRVHTSTEMAYEIMMQGKNPKEVYRIVDGQKLYHNVVYIDITVERNGETIKLENVEFEAVEEKGTVFADCDISSVAPDAPSFKNVVKHAWFRSFSTVKMVWDSLIGLLTGRFGIDSLSGPVGTTEVITEAAKIGVYSLVYIFTIISMNLGVFNLLPIMPLDGGTIVFHIYEMIFRKPVPRKVEDAFRVVGVVLMFGLMIFVTVKDVVGLFGR